MAKLTPAFDFDHQFLGGVLVGVGVDGSICVALPPDRDAAEALHLGAEKYDCPLDPEYPPGDKTKPWQMMKFLSSLTPADGYRTEDSTWASMSFFSSSGEICTLHLETQTVYGGSLCGHVAHTVPAPRVSCGAKMVCAAGFPNKNNSHISFFVFDGA